MGRAAGSEAAVAVIRGDAGLGKSALLAATMEEASETGFRIIRAAGRQGEEGLPHAGLVSLLGSSLTDVDRLPEAHRASLRSALAIEVIEPAPTPVAIGVAVLALLTLLAEEQPVLVCIDDAQWLDESSGRAVWFAAQRLVSERVAVIVATRDGRNGPAGHIDMELCGLDARAAAQLLEPYGIRTHVARSCWEMTGGNPLALLMMAERLDDAERGGRRPIDAVSALGGGLEQALADRVGVLSPAAGDAVLLAALEGAGDLDVLLAAGATLLALEEAEAAGILTLELGCVAFSHPLLRAASLAAAAPGTRREACRRLAHHLDRDSDRRAWLLASSVLVADEHIAAGLDAAAERARVRGALLEASLAWQEAARLSILGRDRARRLCQAAVDLWMAGRVDASIEEFDRAMALAADDHRLHADIALIAGQAVGWHRSPATAVAYLTAAAEETDDTTPRTALLAHAAMFTSVAGDVGAAHELARTAVDASAGAEPAAAVLAQAASGWTSLLTGEPGAEARFVQLAGLAGGVAQSGGPDLLTLAQLAGYGLVVIERWQEAGQLLDLVVQRCRTNGWQAAGTFAASALALLRLRQGHWDEAYATALSGLEDARHGDVAGAWAEAFVALITAASGREAETRTRAGAALTAGRRAGAAAVTFLAEAALGHLELSLGNVNAALAHLDRLHADVLASGLREPGVLWYECDYIDALGLAGRRQDLATLVEWLDVTSGSGRRMWAEGAAALARAWLATNGDADGWFERATVCHAQLGVPFETARTLFRRGRHRLSRGCRKAGRADLDQAAAAFDRLGARLWARAAGGAREYTAAVHRPMDALSPAELRVATVAARGRTNREIATELYVSVKTVDYHLQATYRKLGLRSRTELARLFATSH